MSPLELFARPTLARSVRLQLDPVDGKPMLLYPEGFLGFNETTYDIVSRCDGLRTTKEILALLAEEYEVPPEELDHDVSEILTYLKERNFLTFQP